MILGIRNEDKSKWEKRVPLVPEHIKRLTEEGYRVIVEPSSHRYLNDNEFEKAGAILSDDINQADIIIGVKEIPKEKIEKNKVYMFFSHTIKGQEYNMPMLKALLEKKCTLIDYELIKDSSTGERLIFFGRFAGIAGMIETLYAAGQKFKMLGFETPLEKIKRAYQYHSVATAKKEISEVGEEIRKKGLPAELLPFTVGITGYGHVSRGAWEILDLLPFEEITPGQLLNGYFDTKKNVLYKIVFRIYHFVKPLKQDFTFKHYYEHPEMYAPDFKKFIPKLSMLVNGIYWDPRYPKLITLKDFRELWLKGERKLKVIGDITCDVNGSIELTVRDGDPDKGFLTYIPEENKFVDGILDKGSTDMVVTILPSELPKDSSEYFSSVLVNLIKPVLNADYEQPFEKLQLPPEIKKAIICHKGELTPDYRYLENYL